MAEYDNTNTFVLFLDEELEEGSNKPADTGKIELEGGKELRLAAWRRVSKTTGKKFLSGQVSEFQPKSDF